MTSSIWSPSPTSENELAGTCCPLSPRAISRTYSVGTGSFNALLELRPYIDTKENEMAVSPAGSYVCSEVRLARKLPVPACCQVWNIHSFALSVGELYRSVWKIIDSINMVYTMKLNFSDTFKLQETKSVFASQSRGHYLYGAIGAMDRCGIWTKIPGA